MSRRPPTSVRQRRDLLWLAAGTAILFLLLLGARDLWNPNEPLYGRAVVEMAERSDWLVPTVNGLIFDEKPILYYWTARASGALLGGVNEFTLRLPLALTGMAGVLLVYLLVCPYADRRRARLAAAFYATSYAVWWNARAVQMDMLVAVATLASILAVTRVIDHRLSPWAGWPLAGLAAGLGFLAKGPVGLICPGVALAVWLIWTGSWRSLRPGPLLLGLVACVAVAAPWFVWLGVSGRADFLQEVLVRQNFTRYRDAWDHQAPWWYYLAYFWADMAPWSLFVPLAIRMPDRDAGERDLDRLAWIWLVATIAFFSFSASKRGVYILPAAPAVAILASSVAQRFTDGRLFGRRARAAVGILGGLGLILLSAGLFLRFGALDDYPLVFDAGMALSLLLVGVGAATLVGLTLIRKVPAAAPAAFFAGLLCVYLFAGAWVLPQFNVYKSARPFCEQLNEEVAPEVPLASYRHWKWRAAYVYYADRPIERIETPGMLRGFWADPERACLVVEQVRLDEVRSILDPPEPLFSRRVGSREVYLFCNR